MHYNARQCVLLLARAEKRRGGLMQPIVSWRPRSPRHLAVRGSASAAIGSSN